MLHGAILVAGVAVIWGVAHLVQSRLQAQGIATGFGFLWARAGFDLGESLIPYSGDNSYARALLAGFSNTLKVALSSIVMALVLGFVAAAAMLSGHSLAGRIARFYIRIVRNTPLLLQLFFWFGLFTVGLPAPRNPFKPVPHVYISNRGINFPAPDALMLFVGLGTVLGLVATALWSRHRKAVGKRGQAPVIAVIALFLALPLLLYVAGFGSFSTPEAGRFSINGGAIVSPEFLTLFVGLSIYTGTYIAEVIRGAFMAVDNGQAEAAAALGLSRGKALRLIILPQATRVAMPSIVSELLNLVKNSSLGVAVGYPDLVSAGNTTMNQTGQAIEVIAIYMLFYVTINIVITKISQMLEARYGW
jgi:general L-amino acid transport system permease protein